MIRVPTYPSGNQRPASIHVDVDGFIRVLAEEVGERNEQHISVIVSMTYTKRFQEGVGNENQTASITQATKKAINGYQDDSDNVKGFKTKSILEKFKEILEEKNINKIKPSIGWLSKYYQDIFGVEYKIYNMRKHIVSYIKGFPGASDLRTKIFAQKNYQDVYETLNYCLANLEEKYI